MALDRRGTAADSRLVYDIFETTIDDLARRTGGNANSTADDPDAWEVRRPVFEHLAATGDEWWIAEDETSRQPIGYARSIVRDGVRELTEFFVLPAAQARGLGRELLSRAFPADVDHRATVSTIDPRAIARYLGTGLSARASIAGFEAAPRPVSIDSDLERSAIEPGSPPLDALGDIDRAILGFRRDADHRWLATQRRGWSTGVPARPWGMRTTRRARCGADRTRRSTHATCLGSSLTPNRRRGRGTRVGLVRPPARREIRDRPPARARISDRPFRDAVLHGRPDRGPRSLCPYVAAVLRMNRPVR